jgi:sugar/nucleoside kinase (ribokinase family)
MISERTPKILCAGIAGHDIVMRVERFPAPGEKVPASELVFSSGGCAANAALAVARLGGRAAFAGPLGPTGDAASNRVLARLIAEGVDCSGIVRSDAGIIPISLVLLDADGEKIVATRRGIELDELTPQDARVLAADADAVLVDNQLPFFVTPIARAARERKIPAVIDFDRTTSTDDALLKLGTHVIASSEALRGSTGTDDLGQALQIVTKCCTGLLAVTDGPNGAYWLDNGTLQHMPAFAVTAIDSLAAGDVFHAGFALALVESRSFHAALRFASAAAALKCTRFGGATATPKRAEVDAFLMARGE